MSSEQPKVKKRRNDGDSAVYGISALKEFWKLLDEAAVTRGTTRSALIVDICLKELGGPPELKTKRVGRPAVKLHKG